MEARSPGYSTIESLAPRRWPSSRSPGSREGVERWSITSGESPSSAFRGPAQVGLPCVHQSIQGRIIGHRDAVRGQVTLEGRHGVSLYEDGGCQPASASPSSPLDDVVRLPPHLRRSGMCVARERPGHFAIEARCTPSESSEVSRISPAPSASPPRPLARVPPFIYPPPRVKTFQASGARRRASMASTPPALRTRGSTLDQLRPPHGRGVHAHFVGACIRILRRRSRGGCRRPR